MISIYIIIGVAVAALFMLYKKENYTEIGLGVAGITQREIGRSYNDFYSYVKMPESIYNEIKVGPKDIKTILTGLIQTGVV